MLGGMGASWLKFDFEPGLQGRLWTCRTDLERFAGVFENFPVLVAYRVMQSIGWVLLHSAAFARDGRAQVVLGALVPANPLVRGLP